MPAPQILGEKKPGASILMQPNRIDKVIKEENTCGKVTTILPLYSMGGHMPALVGGAPHKPTASYSPTRRLVTPSICARAITCPAPAALARHSIAVLSHCSTPSPF